PSGSSDPCAPPRDDCCWGMTAAGGAQERRDLRSLVSDASAAFLDHLDHLDHLPTVCCAGGRHALSLAVELLAGLCRGGTGTDHQLLGAGSVRRRRRVDNHRASGQWVGGEVPTLPHAPGGLRADAFLLGGGGPFPADRRTPQRACVKCPTLF